MSGLAVAVNLTIGISLGDYILDKPTEMRKDRKSSLMQEGREYISNLFGGQMGLHVLRGRCVMFVKASP